MADISFVFIILTYSYASFQALTINTCHSWSPNITSSPRPYRFYDVVINIRYALTVMFPSFNKKYNILHHLIPSLYEPWISYTIPKHDFKTWGNPRGHHLLCILSPFLVFILVTLGSIFFIQRNLCLLGKPSYNRRWYPLFLSSKIVQTIARHDSFSLWPLPTNYMCSIYGDITQLQYQCSLFTHIY